MRERPVVPPSAKPRADQRGRRLLRRLQQMSCIALGLLALVSTQPVMAETLTIGLQTDISSMDPHVAPSQTTSAVHGHVYDALIMTTPELELVPSLATSWRTLDDVTWEFSLRPDVVFSDGTPFSADDVAFSINRAATVQHAAGTHASSVREIVEVEVVDPLTVRFKTRAAYPQLLSDLMHIRMLSASITGEGATEDFNQGRISIGTGPYVAERWLPSDRLELVRNPNYWGEPAEWDRVVIRPIANDAARLAGLMSGDLDLIDKVPMTDVARLRDDERFTMHVHDGNRSMFLVPDTARDETPFVTDKSGAPLTPNPFKKVEVREALSLAINRQLLVDRVMDGLGSVANQVVPRGMFGYADDLPPLEADPARSRELLAEAGYPEGFNLVLHCSSGRYVNDQQMCLALAQMLTRAGIETSVEAEPPSVFYTRMTSFDASMLLNGWGSYGDSFIVLRQAVHSVNKETGFGAYNRGQYSNPEVDRLIGEAARELDSERRRALQQEAMEVAMRDHALIPLYTSAWIWGSRAGITYDAGFEEGTMAMRAHLD